MCFSQAFLATCSAAYVKKKLTCADCTRGSTVVTLSGAPDAVQNFTKASERPPKIGSFNSTGAKVLPPQQKPQQARN